MLRFPRTIITSTIWAIDDRKCFETVLRDSQKPANSDHLDDLIAQKARRYVEVASQGLTLFPGGRRNVAKPCAARWPVAICSGALRAEIEYSLMRLDRLDQITAIISAEDTTKCKPDPEGYQLALAALRTTCQKWQDRSCNRLDGTLRRRPAWLSKTAWPELVSAKGAGMWAVGVPNTYTPEQLFQAGADDVVPGLVNLTPEWIDRRFAL